MDGRCHSLTASYVREQHRYNKNVQVCDFYEAYDTFGREEPIPPGAYSIDDLKEYSRSKGYCPYFLARYTVSLKMSNLSNFLTNSDFFFR